MHAMAKHWDAFANRADVLKRVIPAFGHSEQAIGCNVHAILIPDARMGGGDRIMLSSTFKKNDGARTSRRIRAFSLVELLVVVAVLSLLMGLSAPGLFRSAGITNAGNQIVDLTALARQMAVSRNVLTALVFAQPIPDVKGRAVGLLEYGPDREWKSVGGWTILPESVYATNSSGHPLPAVTGTPRITFRGNDVTLDNTLVFYPDGRMRQSSTPTATVRVVASTDAAAADSASNYYDIVLNRDNSGCQVIRP